MIRFFNLVLFSLSLFQFYIVCPCDE